jgi:2-oxoglutarate ferredoxin oxidoreductase subunit beta
MERRIPETILEDSKYCPGCGHGIINRLVAEVLHEMKLEEDALCATGVGCACWVLEMLGVDQIQAQHGRAPAVATGLKRCRPDKTVFTYQGDGDASAIGLSETLWAARRNEKIVEIYVNNGVFGMTGGQMAPTTLEGQKTTTCIHGRDVSLTGEPLNVLNMINTLDIAYLARGTVTNAAEIRKTKKYLRKAFEAELNGEGFSFVEIVSPCPTNWHLSPLKAMERVENEVLKVYPLGEYIKRGEKNNEN